MKVRWPGAAKRRRAIDAAMGEGGPLDPFVPHAPDAVENWLADDADPSAQDKLETIALLSSDPDELTLRAARLLGLADTVYHLPDIPAVILDRARADAARIPCSAPPTDPGPGLSLFLRWSA